MLEVEIPEKKIIVEFPDDTPENVMIDAINREFFPEKLKQQITPSEDTNIPPEKTPDLGIDLSPADYPGLESDFNQPPVSRETLPSSKKDPYYWPPPTDSDTIEDDFRRWYAKRARKWGLNPDPYDPRHQYDYWGAYESGDEPDETGHWPSRHKLAGHPNLIIDGVDTRTGKPPESPYIERSPKEATIPPKEPELSAGSLQGEPDYSNLPVGEPRVLGKALELPFLPGRTIARAPGAFTEAEPYEIERKEASISDLGGQAGRKLIEALHEAPGPKKIHYKEGEMKPGDMGEALGRMVAEMGVEIPTANILIRTLAGSIGSTAQLIRKTTAWRKMTVPERQVVIQSLDDVIRNNPDLTEGQILRRYENLKDEALARRMKHEGTPEGRLARTERGRQETPGGPISGGMAGGPETKPGRVFQGAEESRAPKETPKKASSPEAVNNIIDRALKTESMTKDAFQLGKEINSGKVNRADVEAAKAEFKKMEIEDSDKMRIQYFTEALEFDDILSGKTEGLEGKVSFLKKLGYLPEDFGPTVKEPKKELFAKFDRGWKGKPVDDQEIWAEMVDHWESIRKENEPKIKALQKEFEPLKSKRDKTSVARKKEIRKEIDLLKNEPKVLHGQYEDEVLNQILKLHDEAEQKAIKAGISDEDLPGFMEAFSLETSDQQPYYSHNWKKTKEEIFNELLDEYLKPDELPDPGKMTADEIKAEINKMPDDIAKMTDEERDRLHKLQQALPTFGEERKAAKERIEIKHKERRELKKADIEKKIKSLIDDARKKFKDEEDPNKRNAIVADVKNLTKALEYFKEGKNQLPETLDLYPELAKLFPEQIEKKPWEMTHDEWVKHWNSLGDNGFLYAGKIGDELGIKHQAGAPMYQGYIQGEEEKGLKWLGEKGNLPRDRWRRAVVRHALINNQSVPYKVLGEFSDLKAEISSIKSRQAGEKAETAGKKEKPTIKDILTLKVFPSHTNLGHFKNKELDAILTVIGAPTSGIKAKKIQKIVGHFQVRKELNKYRDPDEAEDIGEGYHSPMDQMIKDYSLRQLKDLAKKVSVSQSGSKRRIATALLAWRRLARSKGQKAIKSAFKQAVDELDKEVTTKKEKENLGKIKDIINVSEIEKIQQKRVARGAQPSTYYNKGTYLRELNVREAELNKIVKQTDRSAFFADGVELRKTPPGQKTVEDLISVGDIVKSNYSEIVYRVEEVNKYKDKLSGLDNYSLVLSKKDAKRTKNGKLPGGYNYSYINDLVAQDNRILSLYEADTDEVFVLEKVSDMEPEALNKFPVAKVNIKNGLAEYKTYGNVETTLRHMDKAERDEFDKFLVSINHPLSEQPGTQEGRFKSYIKEQAEPKETETKEHEGTHYDKVYTFPDSGTFQENKKGALKLIDEALKTVKKYGEGTWIRFKDPESGADYDIMNTERALLEFKKNYSKYNQTIPKYRVTKPGTKPQGPKENWNKLSIYKWPNGWIGDGTLVIKTQKLPPGKLAYKKEIPPFEKVEEMWQGKLTDAKLRYFTEKGMVDYGTPAPEPGQTIKVEFSSIGTEQPVRLGDTRETKIHVIFKAGKKRYQYDAEKLNIITNRYPKATFKINTSYLGDPLIAFMRDRPVAALMGLKTDLQKDIEGIKWASKKGFASDGEYATNIRSVIDLPELVYLAKGLMEGRYPKIMKHLRIMGGRAKGVFYPIGGGHIDIRADLFRDVSQAAATLAHEIGHLVDYLPDKSMARGNILGRLASLKKYMKHSLPRSPGGPGALTAKDRQRLRYQAEKFVKEKGSERWIDEVIRKQLPITPQDVLNIWNAVVDAKLILPALYEYIARLDTARKKAIVKDAMKGVVPEELQKFAKVIETKTGKKVKITLSEDELKDLIAQKYADLINEELEKRRLFDRDEITKELKSLTHAWKPFDPNQDPKYTKYRYSSVELYADAFSALINAPGLLKSHAPNFYEGFFNYIENKPELKRLYNEIQDDILNGNIDKNLDRRILDGFRRGDDAYAKAFDKDPRLKDGLMRDFVDIHWALLKKVKNIGEANIPAGENPRYKMEDLVYSGSDAEWIMSDVFNKMVKPLQRAGLTWEDFGYELLLRRVAKGDRQDLANTEGIHPARAEKKLAARNKNRSQAQRQVMDNAVEEFKTLNKFIVDKGIEADRWSDELVKIMEENTDYATYDVVDYIEQRNGSGPSSKIFPQVGTLKEIANPATATVMKNISIIKAINRQVAAESVVEFLKKHFPGEIRTADTKWNGRFHEIRDPKPYSGKGLIVFLKKGKAKGYYVDKWIADMFDANPIEGIAIAKVLKWTIQPFRMAFVELNYGFWMFNIIRDYFRAATNLPKASLMRFLPYWLKGVKPAFKSVFGIPDEVITEMLQEHMLISVADVRGLRPEDAQIERMLKMYHMKPKTWRNRIIRPFGMMFNYFTNIGRGFERTTKVAGKMYLESKFPEMPKEMVGSIVIHQAGSPSFLTLGRLYPIYNNILMFSNAMKEGYRGDYRAFARSPAEFMWKKAKYTYLPKLLMFAGSLGLMGAGIKAIYDGMSEYDKTNYVCVPLGLTESGKSVYLRVPIDETGRFMGGVLWKILNRDYKKMWTGLFDYMSGQAPTLHPGIDLLASTVEYASGKNPYDHWRGRYAIPEQIFQAGGKRSHEAFIKWLANKSGSTLVYRFQNDDVEKIKGELEKLLGYPFVSNIIGRFIKVSDQGIREKIRNVQNDLRTGRARVLLDTKEAVAKLINGHRLAEKEIRMIMENPDVANRAEKAALARKYGFAFMEAILSAQTKEEKAAVWQLFLERQNLLKEINK